MIVAVTGGRVWENRFFTYYSLRIFHQQRLITEIHEGGATGWDEHCRQWGHDNGVDVITYWYNSARGFAGGPYRNGLILDRSKATVLLAGPGGKGTANMIKQAEQRGLEIIRFSP